MTYRTNGDNCLNAPAADRTAATVHEVFAWRRLVAEGMVGAESRLHNGRARQRTLHDATINRMPHIDELIRNNQAYADSFHTSGLPTQPRRQLAVVACMDSRIDLFAVLGLHNGDAHIIRNAGGVVTDDVMRSLIVSQRLLGTREVLVLQHTRCGLLGLDEEELRDQLVRETGLVPHFAFEAFTDLAENVCLSLERLRSSAFITDTNQVRGVIYDVDTGVLTEVAAPPVL